MTHNANSYFSVSPRQTGIRRAAWSALVMLCLLAMALTLRVAPSRAAVLHALLPGVSAKITEGVPAGSPVSSTGPVSETEEIAGGSGRVWLAESLELEPGHSRVDEFDASTGAFLSPHELNEEGGVASLVEGLAVGSVGGEEVVYVGAGANGEYVMAAYGESGKLQNIWNGAGTVNKSFSQSGGQGVGALDGVAVDNSPSLETKGDVYVATRSLEPPAFNVVDVFKPEAGGREPAKALGELTGTCASPGVCSGGEVIPFIQPDRVAVSAFNGDVLVADGNAERCIDGNAECSIDVFEPVSGMPGAYSFLFKISGTPSGPLQEIGSVAVDGSNGNIYVLDQGTKDVDEFTATGEFVGRLTGTPTGPSGSIEPFDSPRALGVDSLTQNIFVANFDEETRRNVVDVFGPDLVIPDVVTGVASELRPSSARLDGQLNPDGEGEASCEFVWGTTTEFGQIAACEPEKVTSGSAQVSVHASLSGLQPDTTYHYRLQATNKNGTNPG
ncbi:MAG TPA: hypothetical protein VK781_03770, partial [Solirubrobacteraceae bacterium]|nr:hypothetical protein [Solirubrobacteraceae bacterium]